MITKSYKRLKTSQDDFETTWQMHLNVIWLSNVIICQALLSNDSSSTVKKAPFVKSESDDDEGIEVLGEWGLIVSTILRN